MNIIQEIFYLIFVMSLGFLLGATYILKTGGF